MTGVVKRHGILVVSALVMFARPVGSRPATRQANLSIGAYTNATCTIYTSAVALGERSRVVATPSPSVKGSCTVATTCNGDLTPRVTLDPRASSVRAAVDAAHVSPTSPGTPGMAGLQVSSGTSVKGSIASPRSSVFASGVVQRFAISLAGHELPNGSSFAPMVATVSF